MKNKISNKQVGIITLYGNYNLGNKLQNCALLKQIEKKNMKVNTCIIKSGRQENECIRIIKLIVKDLLKGKININKHLSRRNKFIRFNNKYLNYDNNIYTRNKISDEYKYIVIGSDQVWNYNFDTFTEGMFGTNFSNAKKISYAASFGVSNIKEEYVKMFKENLNTISNISVREESGKNIINNILPNKDVEVVLDPTMLLSKDEWNSISKKPKKLNNEKYILNYFLGNLSIERKKQIYNLAKKNGWSVINILDPNDKFYNIGPEEFVYLEEHAELICTDSFHSSVFGILMNTPFMVFNREDKNMSMNSRLETLLSKFQLEDRYYNGELNESHLTFDYTKAYKILEDERKKADEFLNRALDIK